MAVAAVKASMARALAARSAAVEAVVVVTRTAASGLATTMAVVAEVTHGGKGGRAVSCTVEH